MQPPKNFFLDSLLALNIIPDSFIRFGIRHLLRKKLSSEDKKDPCIQKKALMDFIAELKRSPIAIKTDLANKQHYELPPEFFRLILGPRMKYSCALWTNSSTSLAQAEEEMLKLTCERAQIQNGQDILELGCGWGSLTLWMAENYPSSRIVALTNSNSQQQFIQSLCSQKNIPNVRVISSNITDFDTDQTFDRVVSVEMFEHMKNYRELLRRIASWLRPGGLLFVHIFSHVRFAYHFHGVEPSDWITRYFFEGGTMPSDDLLLYFQEDLSIQNHWCISGKHYQKTAEAWLKNFDTNKLPLSSIISRTYGQNNLRRWFAYWRIFLLACSELWGFRNGSEWIVSHYLFQKLK
ncbi:MAG: cyclopropane-fatty-acyl-phospholipid synthase family protein [Chthoniobacterales bacterium]|nr:cyclopropane-fatty-acyl-phospholipid synthase family protein [Chthoniobacterales bacterium]